MCHSGEQNVTNRYHQNLQDISKNEISQKTANDRNIFSKSYSRRNVPFFQKNAIFDHKSSDIIFFAEEIGLIIVFFKSVHS